MDLRIFLMACALIGAMVSPELAEAQNAPPDEIHVIVTNLRNDHGRVGCGLFKGPEGFPREKSKEYRGMWAPISQSTAVCDFKGVPAGAYAVTVLHDENLNGKMDFNMLGIPTKGYGFSNDAKATVKPPSFEAAEVKYSGSGTLDVPIKIVYWTKSL
jgi:uncharacterized protein (DUF2141 family)